MKLLIMKFTKASVAFSLLGPIPSQHPILKLPQPKF